MKSAVIVGDDFEIDHEAGAIGTSVTQEVEDAGGGGHGACLPENRLSFADASATPRAHAMETWRTLCAY